MENKKLVNEDNIIETILNLMEETERFVYKNGDEKKTYVMKGVKLLIGNEGYERYQYFISMFIDFTISVSKGRKININNIKKKYCCF